MVIWFIVVRTYKRIETLPSRFFDVLSLIPLFVGTILHVGVDVGGERYPCHWFIPCKRAFSATTISAFHARVSKRLSCLALPRDKNRAYDCRLPWSCMWFDMVRYGAGLIAPQNTFIGRVSQKTCEPRG